MIARESRTVLRNLSLCAPAVLILVISACQRVPLTAPSGSTITITAAATVLPFNGTTHLTAQVIAASGVPPHSGTHVIFTTTLGTIDPSDAETDVNGRVVVTFNAGSGSGTAIITANSGGASASGNNAVKIAIGAAAVGSVVATCSPCVVSVNGGSSTISAKVLDSAGNPLPSVPVSFTTDNGSVSTGVANSDAAGVAQSILTTNRTSKVTATAGVSSTSGTTTSAAPSNSVTVNVNNPAGITVGAPTPATPIAGQTVSFPLTYATTNATPIARLSVDWGDGTTPQSFTGAPTGISHIYNSAGGFLVRVTATDTFGDTASGSSAVTIANKPQLVVTITASANPTVGTITTFTIAATPTTGNAITSVQVTFGDGQQTPPLGNTTSVQHTYTAANTYVVTATASDSSGASGIGSTVIVVSSAAVASFTVNPPSPVHATVATFDASASTSSSTITSYLWNFGDGMPTQTGVVTPHTFTAAGTFTVTLTITDSAGRTATFSKQITVT